MRENNEKEVDFHKYCPICEFYGIPDSCEPCDECLDIGTRENSMVPEYFKEAKIKKKEEELKENE